jgi:hypothetical protein
MLRIRQLPVRCVTDHRFVFHGSPPSRPKLHFGRSIFSKRQMTHRKGLAMRGVGPKRTAHLALFPMSNPTHGWITLHRGWRHVARNAQQACTRCRCRRRRCCALPMRLSECMCACATPLYSSLLLLLLLLLVRACRAAPLSQRGARTLAGILS